MTLDEIPEGAALLVKATGFADVHVGDSVLVGVKCWIDTLGNAVPYNESLLPFKELLNKAVGDNVIFLRQDKRIVL